MTNGRADLRRAARGMAAIAAATPSAAERATLAYLGLYACGYAGRGSLAPFAALASGRADAGFLRRLHAAVPDEIDVPDWTVTGWDDARVFIERGGVRAWIDRHRITSRPVQVGRPLTFRVPALTFAAAPGFAVRRPSTAVTSTDISRFYLNLRAADAPWALGPLARALERVAPVTIKVAADPRAYRRRDVCVVYVASDHAGRLARAIDRQLRSDRIALDAPVPLLTRRLRAGVGFADDPSDLGVAGLSHGRWVSGLFLEAAAADPEPAAIARAVAAAIATCGRDPDRPYLRAGRAPDAIASWTTERRERCHATC